MTQETVNDLIEFRDNLRTRYAYAPGIKGTYIELSVAGDGTYYVDNGFGVERQFIQPTKAIECFNEMVKLKYELK
jgi:hypothetical protein